ncbi:MAG: Arginine repressor, binding domain, partial [Pseudonocardiales bacterium]|nr:Arginine repressor, binding domain [Pseudonocardiales bacterium]
MATEPRVESAIHELNGPLTKAARQARIIAVLGQQVVRSQAELASALEVAGFHVTQ